MLTTRAVPVDMTGEEFKANGHQLIDRVADLMDTIRQRPVTTGESPSGIRAILGDGSLPEEGAPADVILTRATDLLMEHSLFNGNPRFMGYITSSPAPIGVLADLLAAAVNQNVGANILSPMATAIEKQTIEWLAAFIGAPAGYGGLCVSGGNMANLTAFLAARTAKAPANFKEDGLAGVGGDMISYCSQATHAWIEKAVVLFGHGTRTLRWIPTDANNRMDLGALEKAIAEDRAAGRKPFFVSGTAGDVSTGVVDDLAGIAAICKEQDLWFHVDGAYGAPAAAVPELAGDFNGILEADSIALDPHKWLYCPLEVGCTLLKDPQHLNNAFSAKPAYYNFAESGHEPALNYYEFGLQNSRGFRALKVWMALQHVGLRGYVDMIRQDMALAARLYQAAQDHPELEAMTQHLSIATLRYVPPGIDPSDPEQKEYLNALNHAVLDLLQEGGEAFLSNAVIADAYCLRGCIVNFRTTEADIDAIVGTIVREGRKAHARMADQ